MKNGKTNQSSSGFLLKSSISSSALSTWDSATINLMPPMGMGANIAEFSFFSQQLIPSF